MIFQNKILKVLLRVILYLFILIAIYSLIFCMLFQFYWLLFLIIFMSILLFLSIFHNKKFKFIKLTIIILIPLYIFFSWTFFNPVAQLQARIDKLNNKLEQNGVYSFNFFEKASIYMFGLNMSFLGYPLYPEVAKEQFLLQFPGPKVRTFYSEFALKSRKIRVRVDSMKERLKKLPLDVNTYKFRERYIPFNYARDNLRVAFALNPCYLSGYANKEEDCWRINFIAKVSVKYPEKSRIPVFTFYNKTLFVEEGLFWMLQKNRWFFPYTAKYKWESVL